MILLTPNALGIRRLNSGMGEWGLRIAADGEDSGKPRLEYVVLGTFGRGPGTPPPDTRPGTAPAVGGFRRGRRTVIGMGDDGTDTSAAGD